MHIEKTGSARRRLSAIFAVLLLLIGGSFLVPSHHHVSQQAIVTPDSAEVVASEAGGVIDSIAVETGQWVKSGDLLVTLRNPEVVSELAVAEATRQQARVRFGAARDGRLRTRGESPAQAAQEIELAEAGYERAAAKAAGLQIRAKAAGFVLTPDVRKLVGSYAAPSMMIMRLGDTQRLRLVVPLSEDEAQLVGRGSKVEGRWAATGTKFRTELASVSSHPARPTDFQMGMLAFFGGPVPTEMMQQRQPRERAEHPIFFASAPLDPPGHLVPDGARVRVSVEGHATTLGRKCWRWFMSLFNLKSTQLPH